MHTPEPQTMHQKFRQRSRDTSKLKLIAISTTDSSSSSCSSGSSGSSSSSSSSSSGSSSSSSDGCHFNYQIGDKVDKYLITKYLSSGTFGMVLEIMDENKNYYAVKILSETDHTEVEVLRKIQSLDPDGEAGIVRYLDYFTWQDYHCIVFERVAYQTIKQLDINLHDYMIQQPFKLKEIQTIFRQVTISLSFMHSLGITHTDLKPENIVFANQLKHQVKLIDMGGATQATEHHSTVINTRQYRAPEVILRCDTWDTSSDIWSLACLIVELYTGNVFIKVGDNDLMHLALIQAIFGPIPRWMIERSKLKKKLDNLPVVKKQLQLSQIIQDQDLLDLLDQMFQIDHNKRINCKQILEHQFFIKEF